MKNLRRESVALQVIVLIVVTVSLLLVACGIVGYQAYRDRQWASFRQLQSVGADQFQIAAAAAAWNLDYPQIAKLMESRLSDRSVRGIVVELEGRRLIIERDDDGALHALDRPFDPAGLEASERMIDYAGQRLGTAKIYASAEPLEAELRNAIGYLVGLGILVDLILSLALYFSIKRLVLDPLSQVERYANEIAHGAPPASVLQGLSFPGELDGLKHSVDLMVRQLDERNADLGRSHKRFERVIRQFPSPTILFDLSGEVIYVNDRFTSVFGYTLADLPRIETWFSLTYPDPADYRKITAVWKQAVSRANRADQVIPLAVRTLRCKDGTLKTLETSGIITDDVIIGVANDITQRVKAEEELARYREQLEALVKTRTAELEKTYRRLADTEFAMNHAGIGIQWINIHTGRFMYVNQRACELYGYTQAELLNMLACVVTPDFAVERLRDLIPRLHQQRQSSIESVALTSDNREVPMEIVLYLHAVGEDQPGHCIAFTHDITQRKAAEEALQAAKDAAELAARTRSEFLANMSHEIRTPMNAIIGMSHLALKTALDPRQRNYVEKVHSAAVALLAILNDVLDFSKVEARRVDIEAVEFSVEHAFDNVANVIGLRAEEKGIEFLVDIAPDVPSVVIGDPTRLGQILVNLASNAVKFTDHGVVVVACKVASQTSTSVILEFSVRDSGIGISEAHLPNLFSAFTQADSSISRRFGGTGLGLAICKGLVELMHGQISVHSRLGEGSTFTFTVPFARAAQTALPRQLPAALHNCRVLIVDDNAIALELLVRIVAGFGLAVDQADTAATALTLMQQRTYDLLISDWKMPGMDGVELVRTVRRGVPEKIPRIVIMVSACDIEDLRSVTADLYVDGLMSKPVTPSAVHDLVLTALGHGAEVSSNAIDITVPDYPALAGRQVLLVEDNPINQEVARDFLETVGLVVTVAGNGQEALDWLARQSFDCVLMDVQMPVMDGLTATRAIRAQPHLRKLPIVAMTAGALPEEREQTRAAGMDFHLTKPVDIDQLLAIVARCIGAADRGVSAAPPEAVAPAENPEATVDLDLKLGIKLVNGNHPLYRKLLNTYREQSAATVQSIQAAYASGDTDTMRRMAHTLKGSSALLGVRGVKQAAIDLESAILEASPHERLQNCMDQLAEMHQRALTAISDYLAADAA